MDWKTLTFRPMSGRERQLYSRWMERKCKARWDAVASLYRRYVSLPNEVAASLVHKDMQRAGWDRPPQAMLNDICAERENVEALFVICARRDHPDVDSADYVTEENYREIYAALLKLHELDDRKKQQAAAEAFCRETQIMGLR